MNEHTPIPWKVTADHQIVAGDMLIADTWNDTGSNAAFIVLAVNTHALMLDALREIREHMAPLVQAGDPLGLRADAIARKAIRAAEGEAVNG